MPRYVIGKTVPVKGEWWEEQPAQPLAHPTVYDQGPQETGLLDERGRSILRIPDAIGFVREGE